MILGRSILAAGLVAFLAFWGIACSEDTTTVPTTPSEEEIDFDDQFGGLNADNEAPAFGDADLAEAERREIDFDDEFALDLSVMRWESDPNSKMYAMTIRWGDMDPGLSMGSGEDSARDWIGSLEVTEGAIRVLRLIDWELGEDEVSERISRNLIEWESHTDGEVDGIRVLIIVPADEGSEPEGVEVTFVLEPIRRVFSLDELEAYEEVFEVDDRGNQISFRSFRVSLHADAKGWTLGRWIWSEEKDVGIFAGRWVGRDRNSGRIGFTTGGFVRGHYGVNSEDEKVFFGKLIDEEGQFLGFLRGTWAVALEGEFRRNGTFSGQWVDEEGRPRGVIRGTWSQAASGSPGSYEGTLASAPII